MWFSICTQMYAVMCITELSPLRKYNIHEHDTSPQCKHHSFILFLSPTATVHWELDSRTILLMHFMTTMVYHHPLFRQNTTPNLTRIQLLFILFCMGITIPFRPRWEGKPASQITESIQSMQSHCFTDSYYYRCKTNNYTLMTMINVEW